MAESQLTAEDKHMRRIPADLPPTPPDSQSESSASDKADDDSIQEGGDVNFPLPPKSAAPTEVLEIDKKTPDSWLPRDPRLIRLTGVHPFNVEAPLSDLYNEGFLTSPELFYVRNHGHVPQVEDDAIPNWTFSIEGMVENPITMTLADLLEQYEQHTYPITLVCAGNRRKEQNVVRKTKGFSWGAAGVSTALWTGVVLGDVLRKAKPKRGAKYVCMEGADKLPNGYYGTSVKLNWAMDENKGMMLAHKMNGEMLRPDHGKPLRVVIPGQIGGRSVKWLKKLIITAEPSDNWYHIYDNRVLPTMVSPEESANNPKWWIDERYAIYDLSTNSALAYPAHEEQLGLVGAPDKYRVKGYAYGGGGRRVTRVEISLDKGKTWRLANIDYAEDRYREASPRKLYGGTVDLDWREASFCWCFWNLDIAVSELADSKDILVRAMDESMNLQPRDMYWSVLGMMNNPWYRVTIAKEGDYLRFEHPTQPALMPGGWMERVKKSGGNLTNGYWGEQIGGENAEEPVTEASQEVKMTRDDVKREITIDDLRKHDNEAEPWFVVNGEVFDGTAFMKDHPGGASSIISAAGLDSTDEFMAIRKLFLLRLFVSKTINTNISLNRQRNSQIHDALLPHRHPRLHRPRRSRRRNHPRRHQIHLPNIPRPTNLEKSHFNLQKNHFVGHSNFHFPTRPRLANSRSPHRSTSHDASPRPRHPRSHHSKLYTHFLSLTMRLDGNSRQNLLSPSRISISLRRSISSSKRRRRKRRQNVPRPRLPPSRPLHRLQRPHRKIHLSRPRSRLPQQRPTRTPPNQKLLHDLRRLRHHADFPSFTLHPPQPLRLYAMSRPRRKSIRRGYFV